MHRALLAAVLVSLWAVAGCRNISRGDRDLSNFEMVSPTLYRSGQPTREGYVRLKELGVRTIVNLRSTQPDRKHLETLGLKYENRGMIAVQPNDEDVIWFLRIAVDPNCVPVLVHCDYGSERAGLMVAMYRVVVEGWDRERAIEEMTAEDRGFLPVFSNLATYIREADIESIRSAVSDKSETANSH
jgi:protein tyrosine/serine phosphatase